MSNFVTSAAGDPTNECIKVTKVYDWVTLNVNELKNVTIPAIELALIQTAIAAGSQLNIVATIDPATDVDLNVFNVIRKTVNIDGVNTPVGCAQILKSVTMHVSVYDLGTSVIPLPPTLIASFDNILQFFERAGLCFPTEFTAANIIPQVRSAEAFSLTPFPVDGQFMFQVMICQELQVETEVKLEVLGRFCTPRDNNIDCDSNASCNPITFPEPCANIYPTE